MERWQEYVVESGTCRSFSYQLAYRVLCYQIDSKGVFWRVQVIKKSDGGWQYRVPLILLAICSLFPLFSLNPFFYEDAWLFESLKPANSLARENIYHSIIPIGVNILSVFVIYFAYTIYTEKRIFRFPQTGFLYRLSYNQWYLDKIYKRVVVKPVLGLGKFCFWFDRNIIDGIIHLLDNIIRKIAALTAWADKYIVDGFLHGTAALVQSIGNFARKFQNGKVQYYLYCLF
jgi:NADH-quinone oxidoreductase subunit L